MITLILAIMAGLAYLGYYYWHYFRKGSRKPVEIAYMEKKYKIRLKKVELQKTLKFVGGYYSFIIGFAVLICFSMKNIFIAFLTVAVFYTVAFLLVIFFLNRYGLKIKAHRKHKYKNIEKLEI